VYYYVKFSNVTFLDAFAELQKGTVGFFMSVRTSFFPSAWNNSTHNGRIFMKFDI